MLRRRKPYSVGCVPPLLSSVCMPKYSFVFHYFLDVPSVDASGAGPPQLICTYPTLKDEVSSSPDVGHAWTTLGAALAATSSPACFGPLFIIYDGAEHRFQDAGPSISRTLHDLPVTTRFSYYRVGVSTCSSARSGAGPKSSGPYGYAQSDPLPRCIERWKIRE